MRRSGFTLVELLLAVAIVVGLTALVAPSLGGALARRRVEHAARAVVSLAGGARSFATAEGRAYVLIIDGQARAVRLARSRDPLLAPQDQADAEVEGDDWPQRAPWARVYHLEDGVSLASASVGGRSLTDIGEAPVARVTFSPDGSADPATIELRSEDGEMVTVEIAAPTGRATIVSEAGS
jgi:type II secretion system protein H